MLKASELRVGLLFWWDAARTLHQWSCPGIVTKVGKKTFQVRSLDDLKETEPLSKTGNGHDESCLNEMRACTEAEVRRYIKERQRGLEDSVVEAKQQLEDAEAELKSYREQTSKLIDEALSK